MKLDLYVTPCTKLRMDQGPKFTIQNNKTLGGKNMAQKLYIGLGNHLRENTTGTDNNKITETGPHESLKICTERNHSGFHSKIEGS